MEKTRNCSDNVSINTLQRCLAASEIAGVGAVVVRAIDDDDAIFYKCHGFLASPLGDRMLVMPVETLRARFR